MKISDLVPSDTPDEMVPAWIGCISWAVGEKQIVDAFRADTGMNWTPGRNGLERMIDAATGADVAFIEAFILWANVNVWGSMNGPPPDDF